MASFRSSVKPLPNNCLFCGNDCSSTSKPKLNIPGAGNCVSLNRQLEQLFVVKVLLEIDPEFLAEKLPLAGNLQWFRLCEGCRELEVKPGWEAYQRMVAAEAKIKEIRTRVKRDMEDTMWRKLKKHRDWAGARGNRMDAEIRKRVFPDLLGVKQVLVTQGGNGKGERPRPTYKGELEVENDQYLLPDLPSEPLEGGPDWEPADDAYLHEEDNLDNNEDFKPKGNAQKSKKKSNAFKSTSSSAVANAVKRVRKRIRKRKPRPIELIKRFKCPECGCYFKSHPELVTHLEAHQRSKESGGGAFDCQKCTFPAASEDELENHMKGRHGRTRYHNCPKCDFKVRNWRKMSEHLSAEHPEIAEIKRDEICLQCQVCNRQFKRRQHWMLHQRKMHPELFEAPVEHPVDCPDCNQRFLSRRLLRFHVNAEHRPRPNKYICEECGMGFLWPKKLEHHKIKHTRKFKRDFICHLCGVDYAHNSLLIEHYKKVHPETEDGQQKKESGEEYKCRYCELTSPFKVVISRHLRTHKEQSGHKCEECGNCYINENGLRRHIRMNHSNVKEQVPCPHCRKVFSNQDYMKTHVRLYCRLKEVAESGVVEAGPSFVLEREGEASEAVLKQEGMVQNQQFVVQGRDILVDEFGNEGEMKVVFHYS